jgi:hypothetical protein
LKNEEFGNLADTGDILLFKGQTLATKVQRAVTRSEYDHVAMILRYSNGKLVLLESTGTTGVAVLEWDVFLANKWQNLYDKIVYRSLRINRSFANMQRLEEFVRNSVG